MPTNASHSVIRSTMWKKLTIFLLASWFVSTTGVVTQCYKCYSDISLDEELDFKDKDSNCNTPSPCDSNQPDYPANPNAQKLPRNNQICAMKVTDGKAAKGTIRAKVYYCSDDYFKNFTDVDANGCQTQAGLDLINKFIRGSTETQWEYGFKFLEYCSCTTDLCNTWQSKAKDPPTYFKPDNFNN